MRTTCAKLALVLAVLALAIPTAACGDDDSGVTNDNTNSNLNLNTNTNTNTNTNDNTNSSGVDPVLIPGGGVTSSAIDGTLHVHVINAEDDAPLSGVTVVVGEPDAANPLTMTTDAAGLATFTGVTGSQVVTAATGGYSAVSWFGVGSANVTIPLVHTPAQPAPTATVTGTVEGWDSMQSPAWNEYRAAIVNYSHTDGFLDPANSIEQPVDGDGLGLNLCLNSLMDSGPCNWSLLTRTGPQIIYAAIVIGDPNGTNDDVTDDTITVIGYAALTGVNPTAGQTLSNQVLPQMNDTSSVTVSFGSPPAGLGDVTAVPYIVTANEGRVPIFLFSPSMATALIPNLTGPFAGASYDFLGVANTTGPVDTESSLSFMRNISVAGGVTLPSWMAPPTAVSGAGATYSFTPSAGANVHTVTFADASSNVSWVVLLLDGRTSFTAPTISPAVLPSGSVTMTVAEMNVPGFDPTEFTSPSLGNALTQTATSQTTFTP
jgi:hypothetical protein